MRPPSDPSAGGHASRRDLSPLVFAALALVLLVAFGAYLGSVAPPEAPDVGEGARVLPVPLEIPAFSLVDHRGERFDRSRLEGRWSLLFFGYTYCPDVCPLTLQSLARVQDLLPRDAELQVVFVSVDPDRDTTERVAEYVAFFHDGLVGATGEAGEIERLTRAVGAFHQKAEGARGDDYLVDHAAALFLVDPGARLHAVLDEPHEPRDFVDLLHRVQAAERSSG